MVELLIIMNILFVTHVTSLAGANRSMYHLIEELKNNYGCNIVVTGPTYDNDISLKYKLELIGVDYIGIPIRYFKLQKPFGQNAFLNHIRYLRYCHRFFKRFQSYHFDIVHSNSSVIDCGAWLSKKLKCKHIWHLREFGDNDYGLFPVGGKLYEKYIYRKADAFIAISKAVENHFSNKICHSKIHLIYNGIKPVNKNLWSYHHNFNVNFICAGVISESKNQKEIVMAVDELVNRRHINDFHITIVGLQDVNYVKLLYEYIDNFKIEKYITILPETDGIQQLASKMDVGIVPSHAEAFGRVTIEYMLQNLLVIANDQGANLELVEDGVTGLIYPLGNITCLADKMQLVISNRQLLNSIAQAGRENAYAHFLSKENTRKVYELYKNILASDVSQSF